MICLLKILLHSRHFVYRFVYLPGQGFATKCCGKTVFAMPSNEQHVSFTHRERQMKIPFIIYVYFEALQIPKPKTKSTVVHMPCGFGYSVKCSYDESLSKYEEYYGEDSPKVLWEKLENDAANLSSKVESRTLNDVEKRILNDEEKRIISKISSCYSCGEELDGDRTENFCQMTGQFLGVAHQRCQRSSKLPNFIPIVMHNLSKYGAHFLLKDLSSEELKNIFFVGHDQSASFGFSRRLGSMNLRFINSKLFLNDKIEDLEKILVDSKKRRLKKEFRNKKDFDLMKTKAAFPLYYMDSFEKFSGRSLPPESGFFDRLHDEQISKEEYQRMEDIWKRFGCETIRDFFSCYLKSNVFLLEDIFENFRDLCLDKYQLDPAHYFTIAGFGWDSMLKYTGVKLEILRDKSMIDFIKSNIRGGIVHCSKRHAKANNKYCDGFDKTKPSTFIIYLDANNLGGWAMSQNLPFSDFRWLNKTEIGSVLGEILTLKEDSEHGYFLEVDLDYPKELHNSHNQLPFCSQFITVPPPPVAMNLAHNKPVLNFYPKRKYVIEYRTLIQCLEHGLVLKRIHRVLKFRQCKWLEPYINHNTELRAAAKNDFEAKLYKLLNNSVYGKTIERTSTDRPIYAGFSILELSKKFMYDFHYNHMLSKYKNKLDLLYIDTDGVIYEIQTAHFFKDLKSDSSFLDLMDTSNLDSRWNIQSKNKKLVGKMKDECNGKIIREFFGAGAKVYFLDVEGEEIKKAVGMKKYIKEKYISRDDYGKCVLQDVIIKRSFSETISVGHQVQTCKKYKIVLSPGDKKRFILLDKINTIAWGFEGRR